MNGQFWRYRVVWPILDEDRTADELKAEALADLPDRCAADGVVLCGPVSIDLTRRGEEVPGWEHWEGYVLIAEATAKPASVAPIPRAAPAPAGVMRRQPRPQPGRLNADVVEAALRGDDPLMSQREKQAAVAACLDRGMSRHRTAQLLHLSGSAIKDISDELGISA